MLQIYEESSPPGSHFQAEQVFLKELKVRRQYLFILFISETIFAASILVFIRVVAVVDDRESLSFDVKLNCGDGVLWNILSIHLLF